MGKKKAKSDVKRIFSGQASRKFWSTLNALDKPGKARSRQVWEVLYSLCCRLQELEAVVQAGADPSPAAPDPKTPQRVCDQCGMAWGSGNNGVKAPTKKAAN